jgi:hypothetical protein
VTCSVLASRFISGCGMPNDLNRPTRHDRRKHFRLSWDLPATIYDVDRHLERPASWLTSQPAARNLLGSERTQFPMNSGCALRSATVDHAESSGALRTCWELNSSTMSMARTARAGDLQCRSRPTPETTGARSAASTRSAPARL